MDEFNFFLATLGSLFSVVNPLGAVPMYLTLSSGMTNKARKRTARRTATWFAIILVVFFFAGTAILTFFGITLNALQIAGGLIIINSGFGLLNSKFEERRMDQTMTDEAQESDDISFTPMAMPMLSGPGSISLLIGLSYAESGLLKSGAIVGVIAVMALVIWLVLLMAPVLNRWLGRSGLSALSRIMGFLVMSIGIQMLTRGIVTLVQSFL